MSLIDGLIMTLVAMILLATNAVADSKQNFVINGTQFSCEAQEVVEDDYWNSGFRHLVTFASPDVHDGVEFRLEATLLTRTDRCKAFSEAVAGLDITVTVIHEQSWTPPGLYRQPDDLNDVRCEKRLVDRMEFSIDGMQVRDLGFEGSSSADWVIRFTAGELLETRELNMEECG